MNEKDRSNNLEANLRRSEERLRLAEAASGVVTFELDLTSDRWDWTSQVSLLFGFGQQHPASSFTDFERAIFVDDVPKLRAAVDTAKQTGVYHVEFRVRHADESVHWLAGKGQIAVLDKITQARWLRGAYYEITDRKVLEVRLLALNETLEARVAERARELAASITKLQETEHGFRMLVEAVTDYAIYMLDPAGNIVNWNAGAERIKGYTREEIIGQHYSRFYWNKSAERSSAGGDRNGRAKWQVRNGRLARA